MILNFKLISGIILLSAKIDDIEGVVAFDTGAMQTALNKTYFSTDSGEEKTTVKFSKKIQESTSFEKEVNISIDNLKIENTKVIITDLNYVENPLKSIDSSIHFLGSLGFDIIKDHKWEIDYKNRTICIDEIIEKEHKNIVDLDVTSLPSANIIINNTTYKFIIDTGANTCLLDENLIGINFEHVDKNSNIVILPEITFSNIRFDGIVAVLNDISSITEKININGIIGYQILKDFKCTFDFENKILYLD